MLTDTIDDETLLLDPLGKPVREDPESCAKCRRSSVERRPGYGCSRQYYEIVPRRRLPFGAHSPAYEYAPGGAPVILRVDANAGARVGQGRVADAPRVEGGLVLGEFFE